MHGCWFKQFLIQLLAILIFKVIPNGKSNLMHTLYALCTLYAFYMHYSWTSLSALVLDLEKLSYALSPIAPPEVWVFAQL